jgi:hypothetical protein
MFKSSTYLFNCVLIENKINKLNAKGIRKLINNAIVKTLGDWYS